MDKLGWSSALKSQFSLFDWPDTDDCIIGTDSSADRPADIAAEAVVAVDNKDTLLGGGKAVEHTGFSSTCS